VEACGICHTDLLAVGDGVHRWKVGDRVGVGFLGGQCHECDPCRRGDFINCVDQPQTGTTVDGGYAEVAYARASGLVRIPDSVSATDAAPLLCAGLTTFNALQHLDLRPGALVGIQGIGGLGHLGIQPADKLGYRVVAIARGTGKQEVALRLGADTYIDSDAQNAGTARQELGGADAIVATAASGNSMSPLVAGLAPHGRLMVVGAAFDPIEVNTTDLVFGGRQILGTLTGSASCRSSRCGSLPTWSGSPIRTCPRSSAAARALGEGAGRDRAQPRALGRRPLRAGRTPSRRGGRRG
jgi:alcohol dehydrogenase, propanol-preferring